MRSPENLAEIVRTVANGALGEGVVIEVQAKDMRTWEGEDALSLTLVMQSESVDAVTGDELIEMLSAIRSRFEAIGEGREPIVFYRTPEDLHARA